jgi:hypothetical protein
VDGGDTNEPIGNHSWKVPFKKVEILDTFNEANEIVVFDCRAPLLPSAKLLSSDSSSEETSDAEDERDDQTDTDSVAELTSRMESVRSIIQAAAANNLEQYSVSLNNLEVYF